MTELFHDEAVDLFGGPGGFDYAASKLGLRPLGIEWDDAACATREAVGLRTLQADVSKLDPLDFAPCELVIGSPPCPSFSTAGKGDGIADMPLVYEAATAVARGKPVPPLPWRDERSALVVEPLRWVILLEPRYLVWEQVPPVLPFWEHCADLLRRRGWNVWTGIMEAERYGVPQTRERAILMADREQPVHPPRPTHQRYVKGEPQRHEVTLEGEVLPWVSMAEALGWVEGAEPSPAPTVSGGGTGGGGGVEVFAGADSRKRAARAVQTDNVTKNGTEKYERSVDAPAPVLTSRVDLWKLRNGNQENAAVRDAGEPASTIAFGHNAARVEWVNEYGEAEEVAACGCFVGVVDGGGFCACCHAHVNDPDGLYALQGDGTHGSERCPAVAAGAPLGDQGFAKEREAEGKSHPVAYDRRQQNPDGTPVPTSEPAPTLTANGLKKSTHVWRNWGGGGPTPAERPATTVAGDPRLSSLTHHNHGEQNAHAIRVTLEEAAVLQSFSSDYPFQGTKSKRFEQVGNAVPPLLAHAILSSLLAEHLQHVDLKTAA